MRRCLRPIGSMRRRSWPAGRPYHPQTRVIAQHQQMVRIDRELATLSARSRSRRLLRGIRRGLAGVPALVVSDYLKGTLTDGLLVAIIALAQELHPGRRYRRPRTRG